MMQIPKKEDAVIFESNGSELLWKDSDVPTSKPNELPVPMKCSDVGHNDFHATNEDRSLPTELPFVSGNEGEDVVVDMGSTMRG